MERSPLTSEQELALRELKHTVVNISDNPVFTNDDALLRILRAREFNVDAALAMWQRWVDWRISYRADSITEEEMMPHIVKGKAFFHGKDKQGRICLIIRVRHHNPQDFTPEETLRYSIYLAECAVKLADTEGTGQICIVYDRSDITDANQDPNLISLVKQMASIFQDFYAERLGALYVLHVTWLHWLLYHAVRPTLPKRTREKLHVMRNAKSLKEFFDDDQLLAEYTGGDTYKHPYPITN